MVYHTYPLAQEKSVTLARLSDEIESRTKRDPEFFQAAENAYHLKGLKPPKFVMASEIPDCYLAMQRKGYFCYRPSLYTPEKGFSMVEITDWPIDFDLMLVYREKEHNPAVESFFQAMVEAING